MAAPPGYLLLLFSLACLVPSSCSRTLVLPLARDPSTLRYVTTVYRGPSLDPVPLAVDLGGPSLWLDCSASGPSSSPAVRRVPCRSIQCLAATSDASGLRRACPGGASSVCGVRSGGGEAGVLAEGAVAVDSVDGSGERSVAAVDRFLISCARAAAAGFAATGVRGTLGLGRSRISLPSQVATAFAFRRRFFACLSATEGIIVAGDGPFFSHLSADVSKSLTYTPLVTPNSPRASDYVINLTSIKIDGERLPLNSSSPLHSVKLSTEIPYTAVASPIYSAFAEAFAGAASAMGMARVPPVAPFRVCFDPRTIGTTAAGPDVPAIDLVLQSEMVKWRIGGWNSMVRVSDEATCLGVVDGGDRPGSSVVLGGHQLEDVLLELDFGGSRLGFGPPLSTMQLSCSDFRSGFNSMASSSL
ncbi:hypothetical protein BT93_L4593 [Corymbia citriodora subsp. variegata]|uniref:Peptidase A1 domain-containing protein n=1 Tax=Corymbia citriodora subsp. variegata TaxID=360336 RepID=A0A8T0D1D4_CORYI|nr:hypothetical protein BT93_L4593 [Corymbia citriodora subsp. variegata]